MEDKKDWEDITEEKYLKFKRKVDSMGVYSPTESHRELLFVTYVMASALIAIFGLCLYAVLFG
jgi:hypothetical protein